MHSQKRLMIIINILGGAAVIGSYVYGLLTHPGSSEVLWGGVPQRSRPFYTAVMFLAAAGYFAFTYFIFFRLDPGETQIYRRFGFWGFNALYAAILVPSALWMPLTFLAVEQSSVLLLWMVRIVLVVVGLASLSLLFALLKVEPRRPLWAYWLAVLGAVFFCIQTAVLDALLWAAFFRV